MHGYGDRGHRFYGGAPGYGAYGGSGGYGSGCGQGCFGAFVVVAVVSLAIAALFGIVLLFL